MAASTPPAFPLTPAELDERRLAVEGTIGTMRLSDMEPDEITQQILYRYAQGEISVDGMSRLIDEYAATIH
jgi:hypothetical protein